MENYSDKIQDYIDGLLAEEERLDFEKELSKNDALREETLLQQKLQATLSKQIPAAQAANELSGTLKELNKIYFPAKDPAKRKTLPFKKWALSLSAAASVLIILVLSGVFSPNNFEQLPEMPSEITRGVSEDAELQRGISAFNNKEYATSTLIFHKLIQNGTKTGTTINYYLGLSYLGEENYKVALSLLEPVANGLSVYQEDATYFTGLAYYHNDNHSSARIWLQKVPEGNVYHKKAQKLLQKMNK